MTLSEKVWTNRDEILQLASRRGVTEIRLFGSVARGQASDNSDVDFLVRMKDECSFLDLVGLTLDIQELLGCKVDVVEEEGLQPRSRDTILLEAISF